MRRRAPVWLAAAAAGVLPLGDARAQSLADLLATTSPADLATAFQAICLASGSKPDAQATAAQAAPWGLVRQGESAAGTVYRKWPLQAMIGEPRGVGSCLVTSAVDVRTAITDVATVASLILKQGDPQVDDAANTITWNRPVGDVDFLGFKLFKSKGSATGTFASGKRKPS